MLHADFLTSVGPFWIRFDDSRSVEKKKVCFQLGTPLDKSSHFVSLSRRHLNNKPLGTVGKGSEKSL